MVVIRTIILLLRFKNWLWGKLGWTRLPPLREFVYMEEDTVISLLASTTGGITEQQTTGQKKRISSSITGSLEGGKAGVASSIGASAEKSSEVVRQYVIQSNFKELYEMREDDLVLSDNPGIDGEFPSVVSDGSSSEALDSLLGEVDCARLERGDLVELDVELESAEVYEYYRVIQAFDDIFQTISSESELREELRAQQLSTEKISMVIELMEILMADLVPIVGTVQNYGAVRDSDAIVEIDWADERDVDYEELKLAGFVDEDNLWLDPTRVLFDRNEFTVYARIDSPRIQDEWMPMKLLDVVETVFPGMGEDIQNLPDAFDEAKPDDRVILGGQNPVSSTVDDDVYEYIKALEEEFGLDIEKDVEVEVVESVLGGKDDENSGIDDRIAVLREVEVELEERDFEVPIDEENRVDLISGLWESDEVELGETALEEDEENYLEANFIAIFW